MTTTKDICDYLEALQEMADEGSPLYPNQLAAVLDHFEDDDSAEYRQLCLLEWLNKQGNEFAPDDVSESTYDDCLFEVCGRSAKSGSSPAESKKNAKLVRDTLIKLVEELEAKGERLVVRWYPGAVDRAWLAVQDGKLVYVDGFNLPRAVSDRTLRNVKQWQADCEAKEYDLPQAEGEREHNYTWATYETIKQCAGALLPDVLKIGIHDFLNSLYFISGADDGTPHAEQLREAFNGESVQDRRKSHWTNEGEYLVCDDDEADIRWDQSLESYLDEGCVEGADGPYFDREAWKRDAKTDGRGHSLSGYDGNEHDHRGLCIFRTN